VRLIYRLKVKEWSAEPVMPSHTVQYLNAQPVSPQPGVPTHENGLAAPFDEPSDSLLVYWNILLERRWIAAAGFISVLVFSLLYLARATPIYESTALIEVGSQVNALLDGNAGNSIDPAHRPTMMNSEKLKIQSRAVLAKVVYRLDLEDDPFFRGAGDTVIALASRVRVEPIRITQLLRLSVEHQNPKTAKSIADAIINAYLENHRETTVGSLSNLIQYLQDEVATTGMKLKEVRESIQEYQERNSMVSLSKDQDIALQGLMEAQTALAKAEVDYTTARSTAEAIQSQLDSGINLEALPQMTTDPQISPLFSALTAAEVDLEELSMKYRDQWPEVKNLKTRIKKLKEEIEAGANTILASSVLSAAQSHQRKIALESLVEEHEQAHLDLNQKRIEFDIRHRNAAQLEGLYNTLLTRLEEVKINQRSYDSAIQVVDEPVAPIDPVKPNVPLVILAGLALGALTGLGLAFGVHMLDESVGSQEHIESLLGLRFLGYVARIGARTEQERGLESLLNPHSAASESFRSLRTGVGLHPQNSQYKVIAGTCANSGEGKSLVMSNLAIVCAQAGSRTLLVDADLRRPTVHRLYGMANTRGLTQYLKGEAGIREIRRNSEVPNLDIVTSGKVPSNPAELIISDAFADFIKEARRYYDRIIIDCPPAAAVSDPFTIGNLSDGVLFVTRFRYIKRHHARRVVRRLRESGVPIIGALINDINSERSYRYYYENQHYYQPGTRLERKLPSQLPALPVEEVDPD
jgi:polysaccharide biosynthesis transport protein